ncbi:MAG: hypothetical protein J0H74_10535 [Chitinophagaceae bacterium]|nr:hypothetical protein [Chitinophagaceae bacterium]
MMRHPFLPFLLTTLTFTTFAQPAQPIHKDHPFQQDYSIKYETPATTPLLTRVVCDRNGVIQVFSSEGLLRPFNGAFLYPGQLSPDRTYRPMKDKKIRDIGLCEGQLVYVDSTTVLSNAWAGKLYCHHTLPDVSVFAVAPDLGALLSNGSTLQYCKDSKVEWTRRSEDKVLDIQFDTTTHCFWILGKNTLSLFTPTDKSLRTIYHGNDLTCFAPGKHTVLIGTHDGYLTLDTKTYTPQGDIRRKLPCTDLTVIRIIRGKTWFGSGKGAFKLRDDGKYDYYASRRWLPSDNVADIAPGPGGSVLILTDKGLGDIRFSNMTLYDKAMFYEQQVRDRHIRLGFNATLAGIKDGDISTGSVEDSDNDGLWTSMYLGAEAFRYVVTRSPEALQNCRESLDAMERLYTVNSLKGFPSRSFERRGYAASDTQVWKRAPDPQWDWKSTTSSDEAIGHIFVFGVIAELVDDTACKRKAIRLIDALMTHIVEHDMYLIDWNGQPTTWGRWNPAYVNARPVMVGDRKINSSNIIAMLQTAWRFTGKKMFRDKAFELMTKYGYLDNLMRPMKEIGSAPPEADDLSRRLSENWNHSDDEMYFLGYWGLYRYAFNPTLKSKFKASILDHWQAERPEKEGAWNIFTAMTGTPDFDLKEAIWYLQEYPMDLVDWSVNNSHRKDIEFIPANFRRQTIKEVLPPDELPVSRHNSNRFDLDDHGNGGSEYSAGDIWLLPYWMGRYQKVISAPATSPASVISIPSKPSAHPGSTYTDIPYLQPYSIRDYPTQPITEFLTVLKDRNNHIQILSNEGLLQPREGRLLYPGALVKDVIYRPLADRKIKNMCLSEGQLVYVDDKALFSNAWAGKLYVPHGMPDVHLLAAGAPGEYMISNKYQIMLIQDGRITWSGNSVEPLLQIRYHPATKKFWLLAEHTLFSLTNKKLTPAFTNDSLTCFAVLDKYILVGTHNGYWQLSLPSCLPTGPCNRRLPATDLTTIETIDNQIWFGSTKGAFIASGNKTRTPSNNGTFNYFAGGRWLPGDHVISIAKGKNNTALILTDQGLANISFQPMTLAQKASYYEDIVRQRHIRYGFYSDYSNLVKGDLSTAEMGPHDSDNLWTSMYLVAEMFRYLATGDKDAAQNCRESFDAMERLFTLSGIPGLFGRCIERKGTVTFKDEYRKNIEAYWYPGYAHTPSSWRHSPDPEWDWRGSASSDQTVGQYFALTLVAQYMDDKDMRQRAIRLIDQLTGYIVDHGLTLTDFDGKPTLWGRWTPEYVNRFPDMVGDKKLYSSNIISFLQTAYHFTGKERYKKKALELLYKEHYLTNLTRPVKEIGPAPDTADAWSKELSGGWNNSDDEMYFLAYWGLYPYALNTTLKEKYRSAIHDHWNYKRPAKDGLWNLCYGTLINPANFDLDKTIWELQRMPMDLITWPIHNSHRGDLTGILPPDERPQNKHNRNLFELDDKGGNGSSELGGGDVYLLPYWMGRYFGAISAPADNDRNIPLTY